MLTEHEANSKDIQRHVSETGDYHFSSHGSKVKLTKLGLYMLEIIEEDIQSVKAEAAIEEFEEEGGQFTGQAPQLHSNKKVTKGSDS
jgi:hypothetical protein